MIHKIDKVECTIQTDGGNISLREFSYFQYHFVAAYSLAYELVSNNKIETIEELCQLEAMDISELIQNKQLSFYARVLNIPQEYDISLVDIHRENPLIEILVGSIVVLVLAVVFSGGKIELGNIIKAELPPIGKGIKSIKDIFENKHQAINFKNITKK